MGTIDALQLSYQERFIILFTLNNKPTHNMGEAELFRSLKDVLEFDNITTFDMYSGDEKTPDLVLTLDLAPNFLTVVPDLIRAFFKRIGYPPRVAQEALEFLARLDAMTAPPEPPQGKAEELPLPG